jgi:hypothetical protein
MRITALGLALALFAACSTPPPTQPQTPEPAAAEPRAGLTAAACEAKGGQVIGDIGDGAVHRPDYRCAGGEPPMGPIAADPGGPIATEGAVCCKK